MTSDFAVRPYTGSDKPRLDDLMREVWASKSDVDRQVADRWWWRFPEPPICLAEEPSGRLAGLCAYLPFTLRTRGEEHAGAWFVDFFVRAGLQGRGLGSRLTEFVQDRFAITASLSQTDRAYRVFARLGWSARAPITLYVNPWPRRRTFRARPTALRASAAAIDRALGSPDDIDAVWMRVRDAYGSIAVRSGAALVDRYAGRAGRTYRLHRAYRDGACVGYLVSRLVESASGRTPASQGLIVDYLMAPGETEAFAALLDEAARGLMQAGARTIACLSNVPAFGRVLASRGFWSPAAPIVGRAFRHNIKWLTYHLKVDRMQVDPSAWFLTLADCDLDDVWHQP